MIERRVFENAGEPELAGEDQVQKCPGFSCDQFSRRMVGQGSEPEVGSPKSDAESDEAEVSEEDAQWKVLAEEACAGCGKCEGRIPDRQTADSADYSWEAEDLVIDIADMVDYENAGIPTDWKQYPFEYLELYSIWRNAERSVSEMRELRMQAFLRGWMKEDG